MSGVRGPARAGPFCRSGEVVLSLDSRKEAGMGRRAVIAWSIVGIIGFFALVGVAFFSAILGFAFFAGAPHAFGPEPWLGAIFFLFALLFVVLAIFLLRRAVRRLRSARQA